MWKKAKFLKMCIAVCLFIIRTDIKLSYGRERYWRDHACPGRFKILL